MSSETGKFVRTELVDALHVTPETTDDEVAAFDRDYRVPSWMREARGWLTHTEHGTTNWVHPGDFAVLFEPVQPEGEQQ